MPPGPGRTRSRRTRSHSHPSAIFTPSFPFAASIATAYATAYLATKMPGRTVRVQWPREDEFLAAPISTAMAIELTAVLGTDNKPADWQIEIWSPPHAQRPGMNGNANFAGLAALTMIARSPALRESCALTPDSGVLLIGTEGATDVTLYRALVGESDGGEARV